MAYQVLARKWRPRSFSELVGQEHVVRALVNALDHDRLHHAYLFTGTRGVGKTTVARILAKALNCEAGVGSSPCGRCDACREIDEGRFVDLIEVDAASRTKVEDTRELLENVQYAPTRGRFKVYLIDEVHMLSTHSFNALLKTLEEPPPHVKFLLATTDPQRLPVTILSRCLQFNLKRLPADMIAEYLARTLEQEGIEFEGPALDLLARAADGSMRDALSLLDQAIAYGGGRVVEADVGAMLGTIDRGRVYDLLRALASGDGRAVLEQVERLAEQVPDFQAVLGELLSVLQRIAVVQVVPGALGGEAADRNVLEELAGAMAPEDVQLYYQIGLLGRRDLPLAPDPRSGFEMVLLRMLAFRPAGQAEPRTAAPQPVTRRPAAAGGPGPAARGAESGEGASGQASRKREADSRTTGAAPESDWVGIVKQMDVRGVARELAVNCTLRGREGDAVHLVLDASRAQLRSPGAEARLREALSRYYGARIRLVIHVDEPPDETPARRQARAEEERRRRAVQAIEEDATVKALQDAFNARVLPESIRPLDDKS